MSETTAERRIRLRSQGLCVQCGKVPPKEKRVRCVPCLAKANEATQRSQDKKG